MNIDRKLEINGNSQAPEPATHIHPMDLIGNIDLALHHHMAPADGSFDFELDDDR